MALSVGSEAAERRLSDSLTLVHRLPGTLAALEAGALRPGHLWPMLEKVAPIEDPTVRAEVEVRIAPLGGRPGDHAGAVGRQGAAGEWLGETRRRPHGGWRRRSVSRGCTWARGPLRGWRP